MTTNKKLVLAILGSPHRNGKTASMMDIAIRRAEEKGYMVTKINLYEKNLSFCIGCRNCIDTKVCTQKMIYRKSPAFLREMSNSLSCGLLFIGQMFLLLLKTYFDRL